MRGFELCERRVRLSGRHDQHRLKESDTAMSVPYAPGDWVRLIGTPEWGVGQVQSVIGDRITVNFEHAGKQLVNAAVAALARAAAPTADEAT